MRWRLRKIKYFFWGMERFFRNLIRWLPILISDRDFDYTYLIIIMNRKLKYMENFFLKDKTYSVGADKSGEEIKIARILTDRILTDDYSDKYFKTTPLKNYKHHDNLKQQDVDYLFKLMNKKLLTWWD